MTDNTSKKLTGERSSFRNLTEAELGAVAGGVLTIPHVLVNPEPKTHFHLP